MARHPVDVSASAGYIAGGGLGAVAAFAAVVYPGHSAVITALGLALASIAGLVRVIYNRTPETNIASSPTGPTPNPDPAPTASTDPENLHG